MQNDTERYRAAMERVEADYRGYRDCTQTCSDCIYGRYNSDPRNHRDHREA
jgi:hypothetical protein